jgi:hypothetical protein
MKLRDAEQEAGHDVHALTVARVYGNQHHARPR